MILLIFIVRKFVLFRTGQVCGMSYNLKDKIREKVAKFISNSKLMNDYMNDKEHVFFKNIDYLVHVNSKENKKVLYTCITGNYDRLLLQKFIADDYDYVCFTDNSQLLSYSNYGAWIIKPLASNMQDAVLSNRWHKTHPHILFPEYEASIYIDGNIRLNSGYFIKAAEDKNIALVIPKHNIRNCVFEEIEAVMKIIVPKGITSDISVKKMHEFLILNEMPHNYGFLENNFIYRKHNDKRVIKIMEEWWHFIETIVNRDQLSLPYVLYKNNIKPEDISIPNLRHKERDAVFSCHNYGRK